MPQGGTDDFARAYQMAQEPRKRVFQGVTQGNTLEAVWRSYKRSLSSADEKRIRHHLEHGGEVRIFVVFS